MLTTATQGRGIPELVFEIEDYFTHLRAHASSNAAPPRLEQRLQDVLKGQLWAEFTARVPESARQRMIEQLAERRITPHQAAKRLIAAAGNGKRS